MERLITATAIATLLATAAIVGSTLAQAEKVSMQCGPVELIVEFERDPKNSQWMLPETIKLFSADPSVKVEDHHAYREAGNIFVDGEKCVVTKYWLCPKSATC
jgi:hypothetical protein